MKFFVALFLVAVCAAGVATAAVKELEPLQPNDHQQQGAEATDNLDSLRVRKAARSYGGAPPAPAAAPAYLPNIPCPKNYLFSCQPQVAPVPCAPSSGGYGGHGAYSEPIAQWSAYPQEN